MFLTEKKPGPPWWQVLVASVVFAVCGYISLVLIRPSWSLSSSWTNIVMFAPTLIAIVLLLVFASLLYRKWRDGSSLLAASLFIALILISIAGIIAIINHSPRTALKAAGYGALAGLGLQLLSLGREGLSAKRL